MEIKLLSILRCFKPFTTTEKVPEQLCVTLLNCHRTKKLLRLVVIQHAPGVCAKYNLCVFKMQNEGILRDC